MQFRSLPTFFVYALVFLVVNSLFILNDNTFYLMRGELPLLSQPIFDSPTSIQQLFHSLFELLAQEKFYWRLVSMAMLCISILSSYRIGKKLFGQSSLQWAIIVMVCSVFFLFYARFMLLDLVYLSVQLPLSLLLISWIKTKQNAQLLVALLLAGVMVIMDPYRTILFLFYFGLGTWIFLFQTKKSLKIIYGVLALATAAFSFTYYGAGLYNDLFLFQASSGTLVNFIMLLLLGLLPFIGFYLAGLISLPTQIKRKEEWSIWVFLLLVPAVLSFSVFSIFPLALLIGKHSLAFESEKYRYERLVKASFLLHLAFILVVGIVGLVWAFLEYRGSGFRAGLGICSVYWILSFVTVIGLYGKNPTYYLRAPLLLGPLFVLFFWLLIYQLNPNALGPHKHNAYVESSELNTFFIATPKLEAYVERAETERQSDEAINIYNASVNRESLIIPAIIDETVYEKLFPTLDSTIQVDQKIYFDGRQLDKLYILTAQE